MVTDRKRGMRRPSVDRVDSSRPYTTSNVVLCLTAINYMKNDYGLDEFMALLLDIVELSGPGPHRALSPLE